MPLKAMGVSRQTAYKWLRRFPTPQARPGLLDRRRVQLPDAARHRPFDPDAVVATIGGGHSPMRLRHRSAPSRRPAAWTKATRLLNRRRATWRSSQPSELADHFTRARRRRPCIVPASTLADPAEFLDVGETSRPVPLVAHHGASGAIDELRRETCSRPTPLSTTDQSKSGAVRPDPSRRVRLQDSLHLNDQRLQALGPGSIYNGAGPHTAVGGLTPLQRLRQQR